MFGSASGAEPRRLRRVSTSQLIVFRSSGKPARTEKRDKHVTRGHKYGAAGWSDSGVALALWTIFAD